MGLTPVLLTGDKAIVARSVAREVGIDHVIAETRPREKVAEVKRLQAQGKVAAMVGDGVNDAAALAQADLGLAKPTLAGLAMAFSSLFVVSNSLRLRRFRSTVKTPRA